MSDIKNSLIVLFVKHDSFYKHIIYDDGTTTTDKLNAFPDGKFDNYYRTYEFSNADITKDKYLHDVGYPNSKIFYNNGAFIINKTCILKHYSSLGGFSVGNKFNSSNISSTGNSKNTGSSNTFSQYKTYSQIKPLYRYDKNVNTNVSLMVEERVDNVASLKLLSPSYDSIFDINNGTFSIASDNLHYTRSDSLDSDYGWFNLKLTGIDLTQPINKASMMVKVALTIKSGSKSLILQTAVNIKKTYFTSTIMADNINMLVYIGEDITTLVNTNTSSVEFIFDIGVYFTDGEKMSNKIYKETYTINKPTSVTPTFVYEFTTRTPVVNSVYIPLNELRYSVIKPPHNQEYLLQLKSGTIIYPIKNIRYKSSAPANIDVKTTIDSSIIIGSIYSIGGTVLTPLCIYTVDNSINEVRLMSRNISYDIFDFKFNISGKTYDGKNLNLDYYTIDAAVDDDVVDTVDFSSFFAKDAVTMNVKFKLRAPNKLAYNSKNLITSVSNISKPNALYLICIRNNSTYHKRIFQSTAFINTLNKFRNTDDEKQAFPSNSSGFGKVVINDLPTLSATPVEVDGVIYNMIDYGVIGKNDLVPDTDFIIDCPIPSGGYFKVFLVATIKDSTDTNNQYLNYTTYDLSNMPEDTQLDVEGIK